MISPPDLDAIEQAADRLTAHVVRTPVVEVDGERLGVSARTVTVKLEYLQIANAFKYRGAVNHVLGPGAKGVVTVSSGNHGMALATAGQRHGARVAVVLAPTANPWRRARMAASGAELHVAPDAAAAFAMAVDLAAREDLHFVHPYDGLETIEGTGTLGLEFAEQAPGLDDVVVAVGGGGLAAGVALAMRARNPALQLYGVEPEAAPTLTQALAAGIPVPIALAPTIADSLAAPSAAPMSFALCRAHLATTVLVSDDAIVAAMRTLYAALRLVVEPSAAAGLAALAGPLRETLAGRRVGLILCGANHDPAQQFEMVMGGKS